MPLMAMDVILLKNGDNRTGKIVSADEQTLRLRVPLKTSSKPDAEGITSAVISIPRAAIEAIEFSADPKRDNRLRAATPERLSEIENDWKGVEPWLSAPRSPAGSIGCAYGELLLATNDPAKAATALELFSRIEKSSWNEQDKVRARQGRLRATLATGRVAEAIAEAKQLAEQTEDPEILIEANHIMAQAAELDFKTFLEENPRWEQDPNVIDTRHQLYNRVLELYLYPALFYGSDDIRSARGLWGAVGVYRIANQTPLAIETARDIIALHPGTSESKTAEKFLASLKPEDLASDFEAEAREEALSNQGETQQPPVEPSSTDKPAQQQANIPQQPKKQ